MQIEIDQEFKAAIPPLSAEERQQLEENLQAYGCRDPLVVWRGLLLDGHNRYEICTRWGIAFECVTVDLPSRDAALDWIDANQLGRRNLTPDQLSLLRGRRYNRMKKATPNEEGHNQYAEVSGKNYHQPKTSERLAEQYGVSEKTIRNDGQFAAAVETLKPTVPDIEARVMSGDIPSKQAVIEAAREPEKAPEKLRPHVANNSGNNEWYTPPAFIQAARDAMGSIDTDPASCEVANETVGADRYFTAEDDGLAQKWAGNVWLNPPYAQPLIAQFSEAVTERYKRGEIKAACILVNNATETGWFQTMLTQASAVCFLRGRVKFLNEQGDPTGAPLQGQAVIYMGEEPAIFGDVFTEHGTVLYV